MKRTLIAACAAALGALALSSCQVPDASPRDVARIGPAVSARTVAYGSASWARLDVAPSRSGPSHGTIVWVHGGAWIAGSNSFAEVPAYMTALLDAGWSIVSVEYPSALLATAGEMVRSVQDATGYVRRNAAALGVVGDVIVLGGHSAGGWLAAMAADNTLHVDAVLAFSAPLDLAALAGNMVPLYGFNLASITNVLLDCAELDPKAVDRCGGRKLAEWSFTERVKPGGAPMYLGYGDRDEVINVRDQRAAATKLVGALGDTRVWVDVAERSGHGAEGVNVSYLKIFLAMVADGRL